MDHLVKYIMVKEAVDEKIIPVVRAVNSIGGLVTAHSCQGDKNGNAYVTFGFEVGYDTWKNAAKIGDLFARIRLETDFEGELNIRFIYDVGGRSIFQFRYVFGIELVSAIARKIRKLGKEMNLKKEK